MENAEILGIEKPQKNKYKQLCDGIIWKLKQILTLSKNKTIELCIGT